MKFKLFFFLAFNIANLVYAESNDTISAKNNSQSIQDFVESTKRSVDLDPVKVELKREKNWIDNFSAFLTPLIALITIYIAGKQYLTQRYRVRLDLFEKRMKIIEDVRIILTDIDKNYSGDSEKVNLELFRIAYRHSKYLFSNDIQNYLTQLDQKIGELEEKEQQLKTADKSNKHTLETEKDDIIVWLREKRSTHEINFEEFMTLNKI
ncbi:MAG: hypothetical protein R8N23_00785 [Reichenbachiella sp.]|uniref:hypothetical protein n=1 Tax=Reichenbachiella sp. TaxID=2184521 RepID=UPI00296701A5|nr:hypothetical protein [Reichenbachiella sp.]MDW3208370.1 hypothetical protein [Reichenbachiella sp.]